MASSPNRRFDTSWVVFQQIMSNFHSNAVGGQFIEGVLVFSQDSFENGNELTEEQRSYAVASDNDFFDREIENGELIGFCLDGTDDDCNLDMVVDKHNHGEWHIEKCYVDMFIYERD